MPSARRASVIPHLRRGCADLGFAAAFLALAVLVYAHLWADPARRYLIEGGQDQNQWEWFFSVTAHNLLNGESPLFTTLQNHPLGVNLMANTVMLGLSIPLAPLTLAFGPSATWAVVLTGGLAGSAFAWYWLLSRQLVATRAAAAIGAVFCAFAPPIVSHANAHPNFVVVFVIPLVIHRLVLLHRHRRILRDGVILGVLIAYQIFLGEEVLLLAATGLAVFGLGYALAVRPPTRPVVVGVAVAATVCLALAGPALVFQFTGPQSYASLIHGPAGNDVRALVSFAGRSLAGDATVAGSLSLNPTEQNAFFGWPLVILVIGLVVWLRRVPVVIPLGAVVVVAAAFSLGPEIIFYGEKLGLAGPWEVMSRLPMFESVLESRFAIVCVPAMAVLLAVAADRVIAASWRGAPARVLLGLALAEALVPLAPKPLVAADRPATPEFFTAGLWRRHVREGRALVPAPPPDAADATALRWQIDAGLGFSLPEGYFVGPYGPDRQGVYGTAPRPTASLLRDVRDSGQVPSIGAAERRQARADLAYWRADAVVLGPHQRQAELLRTLTDLLGPGRQEGGVWIWDV
ncbi:glycosyl transferase [Nonomuraea sp. NPDC049129]|uniref:glycosyl transferase n=1 Tax=Nonomuraea sp. NPDC049129 TaxID=3155272 RepID=UPI0033FF43E8